MSPSQKTRRLRPILIRTLLLVLLAVGFFSILLPARNQIRLEHQGKQTLLALQEALQNFHVEDEAYPKQSPMPGAKLIRFLIDAKHLESPPINPVTLRTYTLEPNEADRIVYTTDELAETYTLKMLEPDSDATLLIIDSTEHQSLE